MLAEKTSLAGLLKALIFILHDYFEPLHLAKAAELRKLVGEHTENVVPNRFSRLVVVAKIVVNL